MNDFDLNQGLRIKIGTRHATNKNMLLPPVGAPTMGRRCQSLLESPLFLWAILPLFAADHCLQTIRKRLGVNNFFTTLTQINAHIRAS